MNSREKSLFTRLNKEQAFRDVIKKLTVNQRLSSEEANYILSVALVFLKEHKDNPSSKAYFELAYYLILKYSLIHEDYRPINDISLNYGFYPISKFIYEKSLLGSMSIINSIHEIAINKYATDEYIETHDQYNSRNNILESSASSIAYIAPTSFGKSRIIFEHLSKNLYFSKIAIIVPTKSLISQTTKEVRRKNFNKKVISHDGMYDGENDFIAILTQERALRLLQKHDICFDMIYIDEAHNLFENDERNILLQRFIRSNYNKNNSQKVMYLSPLISNSDNLKFFDTQNIEEQRIDFNIKEPDIFQFDTNKKVLKYNRFVNDLYEIGSENSVFDYIIKNSRSKNFIYLRSPRSIEKLSKELFDFLPIISITGEVQKLIDLVDKYVHQDFYIKKYLTRGILYLHGKIPDHVKDYLEFKFKSIPQLKYLVANSVILEGVNLPIDNLFILNTYALDEKDLTNLIGRVNRLDYVFDKECGSLEKLLPRIHFMDSEYNSQNINTLRKLHLLRSRYFTDVIKNPTLSNFNFDELKVNNNDKAKKKIEMDTIIENENLLYSQTKSNLEIFKARLIANGVHRFYNMTDDTVNTLKGRSERYIHNEKFMNLDIMDKIFYFFLRNLETAIIDYEFQRLGEAKARSFYTGFLKIRRGSLKSQINLQLAYFNEKKTQSDFYYYMGESYGELSLQTENYEKPRNVYIDLRLKTDIELVNYAVVKIKLEEDFIGFKIRKCIEFLYEMDLISQNEYNQTIFGTNDENKINLQKLGFNSTIMSKLETDNQIKNFYLDEYSNLKYNEAFKQYRSRLDDYFLYEIDKIAQT